MTITGNERQHQIRALRRLLWWALAFWAFVFFTPLSLVLRELAGPVRDTYDTVMWTIPFLLLGSAVAIGFLVKPSLERQLP